MRSIISTLVPITLLIQRTRHEGRRHSGRSERAARPSRSPSWSSAAGRSATHWRDARRQTPPANPPRSSILSVPLRPQTTADRGRLRSPEAQNAGTKPDNIATDTWTPAKRGSTPDAHDRPCVSEQPEAYERFGDEGVISASTRRTTAHAGAGPDDGQQLD